MAASEEEKKKVLQKYIKRIEEYDVRLVTFY